MAWIVEEDLVCGTRLLPNLLWQLMVEPPIRG